MATARISIPATAASGVPFEVKTLITHPMESGLRRDSLGQAIPQNIITRFECLARGETVFAADLHTGIAANPFLTFFVSIEEDTRFTFRWTGDRSFVAEEVRDVVLAT